MMMFLAEDFYNMYQRLMLRFLKKSIIKAADTMHKLVNIPVAKNHQLASEIDVGFAVKVHLTTVSKN